jgi:urease accessory protein
MSIIRMRTRDKRRSQRRRSAPKLSRQEVRVGPRPASKKAAVAAIADTAELQLAALYRLMTWLSPAYPIGAFSYSSGIEWAVEHGDIHNAATLQAWLSVVIGHGGCFCDCVFFVHAHRAGAADDTIALRRTAELALAMAPSKERYLETSAQGRAFLETTGAAWPAPAFDRLAALVEGDVALPVAVGIACAGHGIAVAPALHCFLHAAAANLVSAGVRLIPLGQSEGQRVLAALEALVAETAARAQTVALDDLGGFALRADLASMQHETQYTRLFRS